MKELSIASSWENALATKVLYEKDNDPLISIYKKLLNALIKAGGGFRAVHPSCIQPFLCTL